LILLSSDWHLDDNPDNEYRWKIFDEVIRVCRKYEITRFYHAGDLCDRKDRHPSNLVNRLIAELRRLDESGIHTIILKGNHDQPITNIPYWNILNHLTFNVRFITKPRLIRNLLLLPYSDNPEEDWANLPQSDRWPPKAIILHQLLNGSRISGRELKGLILPDWFSQIPVIWAGDVHDPQKIGPAEYIGAPHPINFGDDYKCRMVLVDDDFVFQEEIILDPPKKKILTIGNLNSLQHAEVKEGDKVRIRFSLNSDQVNDWSKIEDQINNWAKNKGIELASIEVNFKPQERKTETDDLTNPKEILEAFAKHEKINDAILQRGLQLLGKASGQIERKSESITKSSYAGIREICLEWIEAKNFRSFKGPIKVTFPQTPGLRLLTGKNEVEPELGANGVGKSSLWEVVVFVLFGTSMSGARGREVTNWGAKQADCSIGLSINGDLVIINRRSSPNQIKINGIISTQEAIFDLIRLNRDQFMQSVMFGQMTKLFYDLPSSARSQLFDTILDLEIWTVAAKQASKELNEIDQEIIELDKAKAEIEGQLQGLGSVDVLLEKSKKWQDNKSRHIKENKAAIEELVKKIEEIENSLKATKDKFDALPSIDEAQEALNQLQDEMVAIQSALKDKERRISENEEMIRFYKEHTDCPTCRQHISKEFIEESLVKLKKALDKFQEQAQELKTNLTNIKNQIQIQRQNIQEQSSLKDSLTQKINKLRSDKSALQARLAYLEKDSKRIEAETDPYMPLIKEIQGKREQAELRLNDVLHLISIKNGIRMITHFWTSAFKRVRFFLIDRLLDTLTIEVESAAQLLGLRNWQIKFTHEVETQSNTIKSGIHILVSNQHTPTAWEDWSGGESQRIRLAVSMGLANLIQRMKGISTNWELYDEPTAWLSQEGIEDLLECLRYRAQTLNRAIWIVDHRALNYAGFTDIWQIVKTKEHGSLLYMGDYNNQ